MKRFRWSEYGNNCILTGDLIVPVPENALVLIDVHNKQLQENIQSTVKETQGNETTVEKLIEALKLQDPKAIVLLSVSDRYYLTSDMLWTSEKMEGDMVVKRAVILDAII